MSGESNPDPGESIPSRAGANIIATRDDVDSFMRALQRTLLFRIEWQDLLSAGPEALVHMGECFLAVHATSNPSLPLFDSPGSVPGLPNISLISNVLHVSDVGVEAFNIANGRMDEMYQISDTVDALLDDIIRGIKGLPSPSYVRQLRSKLQAFQESAADATECAKKAHMAFSDWDILLGKLRRAILDTQGATLPTPPTPPPPPPNRPTLPVPSTPTLTAPPTDVIDFVKAANADDPIWAELPDIDACYRRMYGFVTYSAGSVSFPGLAYSTAGRAYIVNLCNQLERHIQRLNGSSPTQIAVTCRIMNLLTDFTEGLRPMVADSPSTITTAEWLLWLIPLWGRVDGMLTQAKRSGFIPLDVNTWDSTDMIDMEYYRRSGIVIPPVHSTPRPPVPSPGPNPDLDGLVQCTDALARVRREVKKVIRFFDAVSVLGQNVISVHVRNFRNEVESVISRDPTGKLTEQERSHLVRHARSVKAYFSVLRAVASMYSHIHTTFVAEGLDLLVELSMSNTTEELRILRQRSLANYGRSLATELAEYIARKQRSILAEVRSEVEEIIGGF